jgi:hypothetical protein
LPEGAGEDEWPRTIELGAILTPARILNAARKPRWWYRFLRHRRISAGNLVDTRGVRAAMDSLNTQFRLLRPELNWDDFRWMRENWEGPLYIKGVVDADDAQRAAFIETFQQLVWDGVPEEVDQGLAECFRELAYDLSYFVADPQLRMEAPQYFGAERAIEMIRRVLVRIDRGNHDVA